MPTKNVLFVSFLVYIKINKRHIIDIVGYNENKKIENLIEGMWSWVIVCERGKQNRHPCLMINELNEWTMMLRILKRDEEAAAVTS